MPETKVGQGRGFGQRSGGGLSACLCLWYAQWAAGTTRLQRKDSSVPLSLYRSLQRPVEGNCQCVSPAFKTSHLGLGM